MSKVFVIKTTPNTVLSDIDRLVNLACSERILPKDKRTILKLNLSWSLFFPACSTSPWQLEGTIKALQTQGYHDLVAMENKTVVTNPLKGANNNRWTKVLERYNVPFVPLTDVEWVKYTPQHELLVLDKKVFPEGVLVPKPFIGTNMVHLPTIKTHGHTQMTGSMKNAFGGLLKEVRHHCHKHIHEVLVDLLMLQKEIHTGVFTVMDGTVCGDGAGPRTMVPVIKDYLLASDDSVAIDAVSAKLMGFDPLSIKKIKLAHDMGLGVGDIGQIEIVGENIDGVNFNFKTKKSPVVFFDQLMRSSFIEPLLFHTSMFNLCILGSALYHDTVWYPLVGKKRISQFMKTGWGQLFDSYK